jgi:hypothetical protein
MIVSGNWNCRAEMEAKAEGEVIARRSMKIEKDGQNPFTLG